MIFKYFPRNPEGPQADGPRGDGGERCREDPAGDPGPVSDRGLGLPGLQGGESLRIRGGEGEVQGLQSWEREEKQTAGDVAPETQRSHEQLMEDRTDLRSSVLRIKFMK